MVVARKISTSKRERTIPVKVSINPRPALTAQPPLPPTAVTPKSAPPAVVKIKKSFEQKSRQTLSQPIHEWPEEKRRRLMWWLVGGGTLMVIIGWLAVVRFELRGGQGPNLFAETLRLLKTVRWPGTEQPSSAAEQEIRQLDQEVFPKFTQ